jgi:hypothetical protein
MWDGGDVWILGGGASVNTEFGIPDELANKVRSGELPMTALSEYFKPIHDKHVIGINVAYMIGDWIDMVFFGDGGFYCQHKLNLAKFVGMRVTCHAGASGEKWIKYLGRDGRKPKGISTSPSLVSWNGNSGSAAMSIAAHSGAKRIILLGFDMCLGSGSRQHFHDVYHRGEIKPDKHRKLPFDRHMRGFPIIKSDCDAMGIEVINASQVSAITCFRKCSVKELLQ